MVTVTIYGNTYMVTLFDLTENVGFSSFQVLNVTKTFEMAPNSDAMKLSFTEENFNNSGNFDPIKKSMIRAIGSWLIRDAKQHGRYNFLIFQEKSHIFSLCASFFIHLPTTACSCSFLNSGSNFA